MPTPSTTTPREDIIRLTVSSIDYRPRALNFERIEDGRTTICARFSSHNGALIVDVHLGVAAVRVACGRRSAQSFYEEFTLRGAA